LHQALCYWGDYLTGDSQSKRIAKGQDGELLVHEDDIIDTSGLMARSLDVQAELGEFDADNEEERDDWERAQEAAKLIQEKVSEVDPYQVVLAGVVILLMIGVILSGWYWVLPRDSVVLETHYKQSGGHLLMAELSNDGSRAITDVVIQIEFQDVDGFVLDKMRVELDKVSSHSSIAGDDLEMLVSGYTVWDYYVVHTHLEWTDYNGDDNRQDWYHSVGHWSTEIFIDEGDKTTWPNS
jgi:hypothetical protein